MESASSHRVPTTGRCPVCRSLIEREERICPSCDTHHHIECWDLTGRCAVYGCHLDPRSFRAAASTVPLWYIPPPRPVDLLAFVLTMLTLLGSIQFLGPDRSWMASRGSDRSEAAKPAAQETRSDMPGHGRGRHGFRVPE